MESLTTLLIQGRESCNDTLLEFFGDVDCVLLNSVRDLTQSNLNDLLQAGGGKEATITHLTALNEGGRTYLNIFDLTEALRTITGISQPI